MTAASLALIALFAGCGTRPDAPRRRRPTLAQLNFRWRGTRRERRTSSWYGLFVSGRHPAHDTGRASEITSLAGKVRHSSRNVTARYGFRFRPAHGWLVRTGYGELLIGA